jgi:hypothetical protein
VNPSSVTGPSNLQFLSRNVHVTTMLYALNADVVPNWFGVAVADGITDFTRPTLYFHPNPQPAGYEHGTSPLNGIYFGKSKPAASRSPQESKWLELFGYVDRLGHQLAGAVQFDATPNQVVIVPFLPASAIGDAGILPTDWLPIVTDILGDLRETITGNGGTLTVSNVVVAGFSFGYGWSTTFRSRANAAVLGPLLKQVWYFDGFPKATSPSNELVTVPGRFKAIKYSEGSEAQSIALPRSRWDDYPNSPPSTGSANLPPVEEPELPEHGDIHHLIRDFMFLHAATRRDEEP